MSAQLPLKELYDLAFRSIEDGKQYCASNQLNIARDLYLQGIQYFLQIIKIETDPNKKRLLRKHLDEFMNTAEALQQQIKTAPSAPSLDILNDLDLPDPPQHNYENNNNNNNDTFDRAQTYLDEAIALDKNKEYRFALESYKVASQLFLDEIKDNNSRSKEEKARYRTKIETIVGRCELLTKLIKRDEKKQRINKGVANEPLSQKEIIVLRNSSFVRNLELKPWIDRIDDHYIKVRDDDDDIELYKDPNGLLSLSQKQKDKFGKWKRIKNIAKNGRPEIVSLVTPYSITQTLITDCSFVSSITVTALYEKVFQKPLITNILYPRARNKPLYNQNGRYAIKLYINGCYRKIEIDDYLPVSASGHLLCSYSNNNNEFWVSLIEKAFLKVMGGYDFPGSTAAEDLHVLTGWIPERIGLKENNNNDWFDRLVSGSRFGDCLITLSSNKMSEEEADAMGLVPTHAYAVLRVEQLASHKFLLIKNPWASKRWKGRFSANDEQNWTPQLRKALNYNPQREKQFDNGIFWMELTDVCQYFSAIYLNWNPDLFKYKIPQHGFWSKKIGPKNDSYNLGYNPQFALDVEQNEEKEDTGSVWILLSKHMQSSKREEQDKNDFLTLHVYDESAVNARDRRVFYRKNALHTGTYINSPHYLMKIDVAKHKKHKYIHRYTIVVSQYEKKHDVSFTITAYSTLAARFKPIDDNKIWKYQKVLTGKWDNSHCGGSQNHDTFVQNPQFKISTFANTHLRFILEAPIDYSVNIQLYAVNNEGQQASNYDDEGNQGNDNDNNDDEYDVFDDKIRNRKQCSKDLLIGDSGAYRYGLSILDVSNVEPSTYIAIISTFKPTQIGPFKFTVKSVENLQLKIV